MLEIDFSLKNADDKPRTMTREWQEAANEKAKETMQGEFDAPSFVIHHC